MPHPEDFRKTHGEAGQKNPNACAKCHGDPKSFCDECHHGKALNREYTAGENWRRLHPQTVAETGAQPCFVCHNPTYCAACHVNGGVPPE
jgi:hypothetical protein